MYGKLPVKRISGCIDGSIKSSWGKYEQLSSIAEYPCKDSRHSDVHYNPSVGEGKKSKLLGLPGYSAHQCNPLASSRAIKRSFLKKQGGLLLKNDSELDLWT